MNKQMVLFMPHPPVLLEQIGEGRERDAQKTLDGMKQLARKIAAYRPSTIIIITPHGNCFSNGTCILAEEKLQGDFSQFGFKNIGFSKEVNLELSRKIEEKLEENGLNAVLMNRALGQQYKIKVVLDHGAMVPFHFVDELYSTYKIVHIAPSISELEESYRVGQLIGKAIEETSEKVLLICSGDLSHALSNQGPYAYHGDGSDFDILIQRCITEKDPILLMSISDSKLENAAQCGARSFLIGFGAMDGKDYVSEVLNYEGPFGVGYLTGYLEATGQPVQSLLDELIQIKKTNYQARILLEDSYIKLARASIEHFIQTGKRLTIKEVEAILPKEFIGTSMKQHQGAFVSIHKRGQLRGCIGTISESSDHLLDEIIYNAISASSKDPRFDPISEEELLALEIKVDILYEAEPISSLAELDVKKYGVIVEKGHKRGLLLPNLDGVDTVEEQVDIAMKKAGIKELKDVQLFRFEVERHEVH